MMDDDQLLSVLLRLNTATRLLCACLAALLVIACEGVAVVFVLLRLGG